MGFKFCYNGKVYDFVNQYMSMESVAEHARTICEKYDLPYMEIRSGFVFYVVAREV